MKIELINIYLAPAITFLQGLQLKGEKSRARSKFVKLLQTAYTEFSESELALAKEYAVCDEEGMPILSKDNTLSFTTPQQSAEFLKERGKLEKETAVINSGTYVNHLEQLRTIFEEIDDVLSGEAAEVYDILYDALEVADNV